MSTLKLRNASHIFRGDGSGLQAHQSNAGVQRHPQCCSINGSVTSYPYSALRSVGTAVLPEGQKDLMLRL